MDIEAIISFKSNKVKYITGRYIKQLQYIAEYN